MKAYFIGGDYDLSIRTVVHESKVIRLPKIPSINIKLNEAGEISEELEIIEYFLIGKTPKGALIYEIT